MVPEVEKERLNIILFSLTAQLLSIHNGYIITWVLHQMGMISNKVKHEAGLNNYSL